MFCANWFTAFIGPAAAQESTLTPGAGGGFQMMVEWPNCGWTLSKPWPMWGWVRARFTGDRQYANETAEGGTQETVLSITLKGDYLPTQSLECTAYDYGVETGPVITPQGTSYTVQHSNPACDGYPPQGGALHATSSYWISEELWNANSFIADSILTGGTYYWTTVGQELFYTTLKTPEGGDVGFYPSWSLGPNVDGQYNPATRTISVNVVNFGHFNSGQWAVVASHELGHAVTFDHANANRSQSMMSPSWDGSASVSPTRTLDKCGAVRVFPVDLR
jgi:hypothetical protein